MLTNLAYGVFKKKNIYITVYGIYKKQIHIFIARKGVNVSIRAQRTSRILWTLRMGNKTNL